MNTANRYYLEIINRVYSGPYEKVSLTNTHFHKLCFQGLSRDSVYKNINKLKTLGYIRAETYDFGRKGKLQDLHFLTKKGFEVLSKAELVGKSEIYTIKKAPNLIVDYIHRVGIIDYWILVEQQYTGDSYFELKLFIPEFKKLSNGNCITLKGQLPSGEPLQVRNDAIFILSERATGLEYLYLLEVDRATMPRSLSEQMKADLKNNIAIRSNLEHKLWKINALNQMGQKTFAALGQRFEHFCGARLIVSHL